MGTILAIAGLTLREANRRRILPAALVLGAAFVTVYAIGLTLIAKNGPCNGNCTTPLGRAEARLVLSMLTLAGLYVANFMTVVAAVLLPVDTLSGEILSGVSQTLACKPIRRGEIVLGKWLAFWLLTLGYLAMTAGGVVMVAMSVNAAVLGGPLLVPPGLGAGLLLLALEATLMLSVSIAGGTRFSTVATGIIAFGLFGLAFLGGWIETIGSFAVTTTDGRLIVRNLGTIVGLLSPADTLWRLAAYNMAPPVARELQMSPFTPLFPPSGAMVVWAIGYTAGVLWLGIRQFRRRAL